MSSTAATRCAWALEGPTAVSSQFAKSLVERGGYCYQNNCYEIFENFILKDNLFNDLCDVNGTEVEGSYFGSAFGGMNEALPEPLEDVNVTLDCTLEEFFNGSKKTASYTR